MKRYPGIDRLVEGSYRIRVTATDSRTGRRVEVDRRRDGITVQEASRLQGEWRAELEKGASDRQRTRLTDYSRSWIAMRVSRLKPSTARSYAQTLERKILPTLGDLYVDAITAADVNALLAKQGRSAPNVLQVLRTVLRDAVAELDLPRDPVARVRVTRRPAYGDANPNLLTAAELGRLLDAMGAHDPQWHALAATLAFTGLRWGEATALTWADVDEAAGLIYVRRAQWRGMISTPKTDRGRSVPLVGELAGILREHRKRLVVEQHAGVEAGWVFPSDAGRPYQPSALRKPLLRALGVAGIKTPLTVHGLRRTFNNLARQVAGGEVVRAVTGHVTPAMTEHYSHVDVAEKQAMAARVLTLVRGGAHGEKTLSHDRESGDLGGDRATAVDAAQRKS